MSDQPRKRRTNANQDKARQKEQSDRFDQVRVYNRGTQSEIGAEVLHEPDDRRRAFDRLLAKDPFGDSVVYFVANARTFNKIPVTPAEWAPLVPEIEKYVIDEIKHRLSPTDFELFRQHHLEPPDEARARIYAAMDSVIFQAAVAGGPIILKAPDIHQRVTYWTLEGDYGARCWKRLGNCFAQFTLVPLGKKKGSLEGWWAQSRSDLIKETKKLQKSLRARFQERNGIPADWVLLDAVVDTVEREPDTFPKFGRIEDLFQRFLSAQPDSLRSLLAGRSVARHLTPMDFTDELIGWVTGYDASSVRQVVYRLRS